MLVLVTPDPVKTVSSNSFLSELLTGGASYSHGSWTKADRTQAAASIREESVSYSTFPEEKRISHPQVSILSLALFWSMRMPILCSCWQRKN